MTGRIGSLCTGYGGLDMAVQQVFGGSLAWVADNDPGASRILSHHHPHVPNLGDITAVDWQGLEPVDVVCGGYPCQPFSTAGKRKGTEDARHIWPHIARALRVLRPRYAVFENVAGHLSLGFGTVLSDLAAGGFDARWCTLRASDIGAAHQRNRLFLLAWPTDPQGTGRQGPRLPRRSSGRGLPAADTVDLGGDRHRACDTRRDEPAARRLPAADTDTGGQPGYEEPPGGRDGVRQRLRADVDGRGETAADTEGDGRDEGRAEPAWQQGGLDAPLGGAPDWGPYRVAVDRWAQVIGRPAPRPTDDLGRLNPPLVEWLMGLPAGHVTSVPGLSRTAQLKALGNGVVPQQAAYALQLLTAAVEDGHQERGRAA
ncbi:DNA cytosine methyltransferase [Streptomyces halobius]|uniref:DNA (cytosine-5-)-methyltransferase n=1 Tax=Streptomyces halobius TaxID=2879846 RepID=A0ABY4M742_9ACTN|nr:DNA cytosine methyltransferase [Streptomyces halobius]UQA93108.1 DNA cytosine methyltransferase [Streptomyces halobius]